MSYLSSSFRCSHLILNKLLTECLSQDVWVIPGRPGMARKGVRLYFWEAIWALGGDSIAGGGWSEGHQRGNPFPLESLLPLSP